MLNSARSSSVSVTRYRFSMISSLSYQSSTNDRLKDNIHHGITDRALRLDILNGGDDEDILIAGRTTSDALFSKLNRKQLEWTSGNSYVTRITNLRTGVGSPVVSLKTKINVLNDAGEDDSLIGGNNSDWYFRALDDVITGHVVGELLDVL